MHSVEIFSLVVGIFLAVVVPHYVASLLHVPPSVTLLVGGGALAFIPGLPVVQFDPELILVVFLPPLLADSAWFTALASFRRHLASILSLAIGAMLFTTVVVAVITKLLVPALPWGACAALGAIVSPPDTVSARAVLQHVRLPRRLNTLLEGESLLNDATGLVLLRFAREAARAAQRLDNLWFCEAKASGYLDGQTSSKSVDITPYSHEQADERLTTELETRFLAYGSIKNIS